MTNASPEPSNGRRNLLGGLSWFLRRRSTIAVGVGSLIVGAAGYTGIRYFVYQKLPEIVEAQLSELLQRPVNVGEVERFWLLGLRLGPTSLPATATDPDTVTIKAIEVGANPLPLLLGQPLKAKATIVEIDAYAEQDETGQWLALEWPQPEEPRELPIPVDVNVELQDTEITLRPYSQPPEQNLERRTDTIAQSSTLTIQVDGQARYLKQKEQSLDYDFQAEVASALIDVTGQTTVETGETQVKLALKKLDLAQLAALVPNLPISLDSGLLNLVLDANVPSFEAVTETKTDGDLTLDRFLLKVSPLQQPIIAQANVKFAGSQVDVSTAVISLGNLRVQAAGNVHFQNGFDLKIDVRPFSVSDIDAILAVTTPENVSGQIQGILNVQGPLLAPTFTGKIDNPAPIRIDRLEITELLAEFAGDLDKFVLKRLRATPREGGQITGSGVWQLGIKQAIADQKTSDPLTQPVAFNFDAELPIKALAAPYAQFEAISIGTLTAKAQIKGTVSQPDALVQWNLPPAGGAGEPIYGSGKLVFDNNRLTLSDNQLRVGGGQVLVDAAADLGTKRWQSTLQANGIDLKPFLALLPLQDIAIGTTNLSQATVELTGRLDTFEPNTIQGLTQLALQVDGGDVAINSRIREGFLTANANADGIGLAQWLPDLPITVAVNRAQADITGDLEAVWRSRTTGLDLSSFRLTSQIQLAVAEGLVNLDALLERNQWQAVVNSQNLNTPVLLSQLNQILDLPLKEDPGTLDLPNLNAQLNLAGDISTLLQPDGQVPIQANTVAVQLGEQSLNASGQILLASLRSQPEIISADLQVAAQADLAQLPIDEALELLPVERELLPASLDVSGKANFTGQLLGHNLLSQTFAPGSATVTGNLKLANLALNQLVFDPVLTGPIRAGIGQNISLDLRGQQDVIALAAEPCTASNCRLPYLPVALEFRQGANRDQPIVATGKRNGDRFLVAVEQFPLDSFAIAPLARYGVSGPIEGDVSANVEVNLFTLSLKGDVQLDQPGVGMIRAKQAAAEFAYDSQRQWAQIKPAFLAVGESRYELAAALNLKTWELDSKAWVKHGHLEDLVALLPTPEIQDLIAILQRPALLNASEIHVTSRGNPNGALAEQLSLLWRLEQQIKTKADQKRRGRVPDLLDFRGTYSAEITAVGVIKSPETSTWQIPDVSFDLAGDRWDWNAFSPFPAIVEPLGLVIEGKQEIPINELLIRAHFSDGTLRLDPARLQLEETLFSATGEVSFDQLALNFAVEDFSLDLIRPFVTLPVDIAGVINVDGQLGGRVSDPQLVTQIVLSDGAFNGRTLEETITANLTLQAGQLELHTIEPASLQLDAMVANLFPLGATKSLAVDLKVETAAIEAFDELLTQGQLVWQSGDADINLQVRGNFELFSVPPLEQWQLAGIIHLTDAMILSQAFPQAMTINGQVLVENNRLRIPELMGSFANSQIAIAGVLPLYAPLRPNDPDQTNPLTVVIDQGQMDLEGLYAGGLDAQVIVGGSLLGPLFHASRPGLIVSGMARLSDGQVFVPERKQQAIQASAASQRWGTDTSQPKDPLPLLPQLDNFQVVLEDLKVEEFPLFRFGFGGDLVLNGDLLNLKAIQADGTVQLDYGQVSLVETRFVVDRVNRNKNSRYGHNTINFSPEKSLFNPDLNVHLRSYISELPESQKRAFSQSTELPQANEFPDDSLNTVRRVNVFLSLEGEVAQLLPNLGKSTAEICQIRAGGLPPIQYIDTFSAQELEQLSACLEALAFQSESEDTELLNPYVVKLTSRPNRSRGQIIQLLANQILVLADALGGSNQSSLIQTGIVQLAVPLLFQNIVYDVEYSVGRALGATDLTLFPIVEASYGVGEDSYLSLIYDYTNTEGRLQFETRF